MRTTGSPDGLVVHQGTPGAARQHALRLIDARESVIRRPGDGWREVAQGRHQTHGPVYASQQPEDSVQRVTLTCPTSTRIPEEAGLPFASCSVTVTVENSVGDTPAHNVTVGPWLKVPAGTRIPAAFLSQAW